MRRALYVLLFAGHSLALHAATRTWTGIMSQSWSNAGNWSGGVAPSAGDDLVFGDGAERRTTVNDLPAGTEFHSLTVNPTGIGINAAYTLTGNRIAVSGRIAVAAPQAAATFSLPIAITSSQVWTLARAAYFTATIDLGANTLELRPAATDDLVNVMAPVTGSGALTLGGAGMTITSATHTYTGPTTIRSGSRLSCSGCAIAGAVNVSGEFDLHINALLDVTTTSAGFVTSTGGWIYIDTTDAHFAGLSLDAASLLGFEGVPTFKIIVTGPVTLGGAQLHFFPAPPNGIMATLIDNDGTDPISGTFAGWAEGTTAACPCGRGFGTISYRGGTGNDVTIAGQMDATYTLLAVSPPRATSGQSVKLTASVVSASAAPSGLVTFFDGDVVLGTQPVENRKASITTSALGLGEHHLTAVFTPASALFGPSASAVVVVLVSEPVRRRAAGH